jgi:hypothetical protein
MLFALSMLFPLLALGTDTTSPTLVRDPSKPTHFELDGEYKKICQTYDRRYVLARILWLGFCVKKWIEATIPSPIQQNLRWRYFCYLSAKQNSSITPSWSDGFIHPLSAMYWPDDSDTTLTFLKSAPEWMNSTIRTFGGLICAYNTAESGDSEDETTTTDEESTSDLIFIAANEDGIWIQRFSNEREPLSEKIVLQSPGEKINSFLLPIQVEYCPSNSCIAANIAAGVEDVFLLPEGDKGLSGGLLQSVAFDDGLAFSLEYLEFFSNRYKNRQVSNLKDVMRIAEMTLAGQISASPIEVSSTSPSSQSETATTPTEAEKTTIEDERPEDNLDDPDYALKQYIQAHQNGLTPDELENLIDNLLNRDDLLKIIGNIPLGKLKHQIYTNSRIRSAVLRLVEERN